MNQDGQKTLLAFGNFDPDGGRAWIIATGLKEEGFAITPCNTQVKGITGKWRDLYRQWRRLERKPDAVLVPFLGHWVLPLAWLLTRRPRTPLVFDAFLSLYDTEVHDRKKTARRHPYAWFLWCTDWLCCRLADTVLVDTEEHKTYFVTRLGVKAENVLVLPIGCRTDLFVTGDARDRAASDALRVEFHGTFIPLQGIETILRAAAILQDQHEDVRFTLIGKGQTYPAMRTLAEDLALKNVEFTGPLPMRDVPKRIAESDVCLGIFGVTEKAGRVIPNKAYEILNCGRALVTARTDATARMLLDGVDALLTAPGDAADLAAKILALKRGPELARTLGENGRRLSLERFQPRVIVSPLAAWIRARLHG